MSGTNAVNGANRLSERTARLKSEGCKALVSFLTAGYPDVDTFCDTVIAADTAGSDVIEIGIPFSDPIADGPTIQASSTAALAAGMTLEKALRITAQLRPSVSAELVFMSYINPILNFGPDRFADAASKSGVSGVILPDVSFEESAGLRSTFAAAGIDTIDLVAPTSSDTRVHQIASGAAGFLYLVSLTGVTGARSQMPGDLPDFVARVRVHTTTPAYVGFGISTPEQASEVARSADGVIIGSKLIRLVDDGTPARAAARVGDFLTGVRAALDARPQHASGPPGKP